MRLIDADALIKKHCKEPAKGDCKNCDWYGDTWCRCEIFGVQIADALTIEAEPVRHGRWEVWYGHEDGWNHHRCTNCEEPALFQYEYIDDWDEDSDGEWVYLGQRENGVQEFLTNHCPNCGARMDGE